jgi:hypothetical protein
LKVQSGDIYECSHYDTASLSLYHHITQLQKNNITKKVVDRFRSSAQCRTVPVHQVMYQCGRTFLRHKMLDKLPRRSLGSRTISKIVVH